MNNNEPLLSTNVYDANDTDNSLFKGYTNIVLAHEVNNTKPQSKKKDVEIVEQPPVEYQSPVTPVTQSGIEAKKDDIERRRQDSVSFATNDNYFGYYEDIDLRTNKKTGEFIGFYTKEYRNEDENAFMIKADTLQNLLDKINAKYNAELKALENKVTSEIKSIEDIKVDQVFIKKTNPSIKAVIVGIDKSKQLVEYSTDKVDGEVEFQDFIEDWILFNLENEIKVENVENSEDNLLITYTPKGKQTQTYTVKGTKIFNSKSEEVFKEDSADRRKIYANLAVKQGRAKVVEDNKGVKYVVNDKLQIMSTATGKIMQWADNHATRKLLLDKYNKLLQNNLNNTRNSENNSVSLSEPIINKDLNEALEPLKPAQKLTTEEKIMSLQKLMILNLIPSKKWTELKNLKVTDVDKVNKLYDEYKDKIKSDNSELKTKCKK